MFELRAQHPPANPGAATAGLTLGCFATYDQALAAMDAEQGRLTEQLDANGEGSADLRLDMAIIEMHGGTETGWLWSSYRPRMAPADR
jgi:hypothetical protein